MLLVYNKEADQGWWKGQDSDGNIGIFPAK